MAPGIPRGTFSIRNATRFMLVVALVAAFTYASYLSYWGSRDTRAAFSYQSAVVAAQRDSELLAVELFERHATADQVEPYQKLLESDLGRIDAVAEDEAQRAPAFSFGTERADYDRLTTALVELQERAERRFESIVRKNKKTRDLSNGMFAFIALLFAGLVGRLRRALDEGRSLVERLQRAFVSKRRELPNIDLGSVLISATRGSSVGGDTHDAYTFDRRFAMFLVADVSGKGIDAAVDTALIKYTIRTLFSVDPDPGLILAKFAKIYMQSAENPETFVVLFLAVIDLRDGTVRYASAGHEPAWAAIGKTVVQLEPSGSIVGIEADAHYDTHEIHLREGDALVISTDGLTESRDARGNLLGAEGVSQWLAQLSGSAQNIADALVRRLRRRSRRITDDLAILVVRYAPSSATGATVMDVSPVVPYVELALANQDAT